MATDTELAAYTVAECRAALTRAKWAARKLSRGIDSQRVEALNRRIISCLELLGEVNAKEVKLLEVFEADEELLAEFEEES